MPMIVSEAKGKGYGRQMSSPMSKAATPRAAYLLSTSVISSERGAIGPLCKKNIRTTQ